MNNSIAIDAVVGALMPLIIAVVTQAHWSPRVKAAVALGVCVVAAASTEALQGSTDWRDWRSAVVVTFGAALAFYHAWWKPSGIAAAVEQVTTFSRASAGK